ncbi:hypothetical protein [Paenibacillus larvae]|uniref:hypothetical protein n=1 Tax=Paenibacillus larvae TaxID=1464 RepID=UPI0022832710|nr:hypothetical protein [Paenibacillus larvae]MCY9500041.1 hypothetical protein [Paenibacillus larvae]
MVIDLQRYKEKKLRLKRKKESVMIPVFERIFIKNNKLIGEQKNGNLIVIKDYGKE